MLYKIQVLLLILLIPIGAVYFYARHEGMSLGEMMNSSSTTYIHIGELPVKVEVADTDLKRIQGLSGKDDLGEYDGMFFIFNTADRHSMWMKDMKFPIDLIWIGPDRTVVGVEQNLRPESYPMKYYAPKAALYALETETEFVNAYGIMVGDRIRIPLHLIPDSY